MMNPEHEIQRQEGLRRMVVFGKGGVGKTTVAANLSILFHQHGCKVLHVGCDPKHDAHLRHSPDGSVTTVMEEFIRLSGAMGPEEVRDLIVTTETGVDVLETGGPEPGKGCAGRAVSIVLRLVEGNPRIRGQYDVVIFDVLGDVVCGGFATPIRSLEPSEILLVVGREYMSLYAANNIARGVENLASLGASRVVGVVGNRIQTPIEFEVVNAFASALGTRVLGIIPPCDELFVAEIEGKTLLEIDQDSDLMRSYRDLFRRIESLTPADRVVPRPMADHEIRQLYRELGARRV